MFGGAGIFRDGLMFALVSDNEIFLKADAETVERFRAAGSGVFTYSKKGKPATLSYWSVPDEALDDGEALRNWAELAFAAALRAEQAKKPRKPG